MLNFGFTHLTSDGSAERQNIKEALSSIKKHLLAADFNNYQSIHASMTIYPKGNQWFAEAHNDLINWFSQ